MVSLLEVLCECKCSLISIKERHIAAFFAMKFFFGITTNSDAYDAGRLHFSSTLATYGKISKENKQKVYYMCECQGRWLNSLIPDTEDANVAMAKSSADDDFEGDDQASDEDSAEDEREEDSAEDEEEDVVISVDDSLLALAERSRSVPTNPNDSYTEDSFVVADDDEEVLFSYDAKRDEPVSRKKRKRGESPRLPRKSSVSKRGRGRARGGTRSGKTTRSKGAQKQGKAKQGKVQQRGKEKKGGTKRKGKMVPRKTQPPRKRTQHQPPKPRASPKQPKRFSFSALRPRKD